MHNHRRRLFWGRFPNTTFLWSLCLPLKPGSHMPLINQRCSRPCRLSYFSDECEHASPATQAIAELYRRHASLRCSRPTHSSKPYIPYLYTEGLERLRRRQPACPRSWTRVNFARLLAVPAFSLKIRLVLISSSAIANHDPVITIRDWDETPSSLAA